MRAPRPAPAPPRAARGTRLTRLSARLFSPARLARRAAQECEEVLGRMVRDWQQRREAEAAKARGGQRGQQRRDSQQRAQLAAVPVPTTP